MNKVTEIMNAQQYFEEHQRALAALEHGAIDQIADELVKAYEGGKMMYLFGNGGSASLASHLACDLGKGTAYCNGGKRLRVLALTDNVATMTAWANDFSYEDMFSEQLRNFVQPQDIAFAISGSGNSKNVLNALRVAREAGATTIGISGYRGGEMKSLCDICAIVPSDNMQVIEDLHLAMAHSIFRIVYTRITQKSMSVASPG
jgi:D-sedoheptulose 7-phosphate isomerase